MWTVARYAWCAQSCSHRAAQVRALAALVAALASASIPACGGPSPSCSLSQIPASPMLGLALADARLGTAAGCRVKLSSHFVT